MPSFLDADALFDFAIGRAERFVDEKFPGSVDRAKLVARYAGQALLYWADRKKPTLFGAAPGAGAAYATAVEPEFSAFLDADDAEDTADLP